MGMREKKAGFILRITGFGTREIKQLVIHLKSGVMSWGPADWPWSLYLVLLTAETVAVTLLPLLPPALPDLGIQVCVQSLNTESPVHLSFGTQPQCTPGRLPRQSVSVPVPSPCPCHLCAVLFPSPRPVSSLKRGPDSHPHISSPQHGIQRWIGFIVPVRCFINSNNFLPNGAWEANFPHVPLFGGCCCLV